MNKAVETEVLIVGAGPAALFSVFELGLFGIKCHLVDILDRPGGQCTELYSDKPIYDIPAFPSLNAQELVDRLMAQIAPFSPQFSFNRMVSDVERLTDGTFRVQTDENEIFGAKAVVIATGGGSFQPKKPSVPGIEAFEHRGVSYAVRRIEDFRDHDLTVMGGDESAFDWALKLLPVAKSLTLLQKSPDSPAETGSREKLRLLQQSGKFDLRSGRISALKGAGGHLEAIAVKGEDGEFEITCTRLLPFLGRTTKAGPVAGWGLEMQNDLIRVDTEKFETSMPGVFAIGDACFYPGKLRLIVSAFHEATLMTQGVRRYVGSGGRPAPQYTTSSTEMQTKLGVR